MRDIGEQLRQARQNAGLSLERLSARTKIQVSMLEAIERGDFARLPGGVFTRGFLRAYAREVGLDGVSVVQEYVAAIEPPPAPDLQPAGDESPATDLSGSPARGLWPVVAVAGLLLLALLVFGPDRSPAPAGEPQVAAAIGGRMQEQPSAEATSGERVHAAAPVEAPLRLEIRPAGPVWVAASADGTRRVYRLMQPGERELLEAEQEIVLRVGDAAVFEYLINGAPGRPLGGPGEVHDLHITRENVRTLQR
jgi:cytoskeleton protein RodZ